MKRPASRAATVAVVAALAATTSGIAYGASLLLTADGLGAAAVEDVAIPRFTPSLSGASVPSSITAGQTVASQATLSGATTSATGTITHELFSGTTCSGAAFGMQTTAVTGNGPKTSGSLAPTATGTYSWRLSYSGDVRNAAITGSCGNGGTVIVSGSVTLAAPASLTVSSCSAYDKNNSMTVPLSWTAASGASGYTVYTSTSSTPNATDRTQVLDSTATTYSWTLPTSGTADHYFWVTARTSSAESERRAAGQVLKVSTSGATGSCTATAR